MEIIYKENPWTSTGGIGDYTILQLCAWLPGLSMRVRLEVTETSLLFLCKLLLIGMRKASLT